MENEPAPQGSYRRLFPKAALPIPAVDDWKLNALAAAMRDVDRNGDSEIPSGFTYFGQFIDHDLTWNRDRFDRLLANGQCGPNFRTAQLDLDHIYGCGPAVSSWLYEGDAGAECFKIGTTLPGADHHLPGGKPRDYFFEGADVEIGHRQDFRDTHNLFVRQVHVLFLKFHNVAVAQLQRGEVEGNLPESGTIFERARCLVAWHFQWFVWWDFLRLIIDPNLFRAPVPLPATTAPSPVRLPLEFALAAFRFGHSMVRQFYGLNRYRPLESLTNLINAQRNAADRLRDDQLLEWGRFFHGPKRSGPPNFARRIDTNILPEFHTLHVPLEKLVAVGAPTSEVIDLPARTLIRGARAALASGQEAAAALNEAPLPDKVWAEDLSESGEKLREVGLTQNTPLWYYILKEAEATKRGERLGRVGSRIVLETIEEVLRNDPSSYLACKGPQWKPAHWKFPDRNPTAREPLLHLADLVRLVGDDELLPPAGA